MKYQYILLVLIVAFISSDSLSARTVKILYLKAPKAAPQEAFLYQVSEEGMKDVSAAGAGPLSPLHGAAKVPECCFIKPEEGYFPNPNALYTNSLMPHRMLASTPAGARQPCRWPLLAIASVAGRFTAAEAARFPNPLVF